MDSTVVAKRNFRPLFCAPKPNLHHATNGALIGQSKKAVHCRYAQPKPAGRTRRFIVLFHGVKQNMAERVLLSIKVPPPILCSHSQAEVPKQNFRSLEAIPVRPVHTVAQRQYQARSLITVISESNFPALETWSLRFQCRSAKPLPIQKRFNRPTGIALIAM
jgi:hypothetical protein